MSSKHPDLVFNIGLALIALGAIVAGIVHRSGLLASFGIFILLVLGVGALITRRAGEAGRLLAGKADDERHRQFQLQAWAATGQMLMCVLMALWVIDVVRGGEQAFFDGDPWMLLVGVGAVTGGGTVLWQRLRG